MKASNALMALILFLGMALMVSATMPVLNPVNNQLVNENSTLAFSVSATYSGTDSLDFFVSPGLPSGATFTVANNLTRSFTWTPTFDQAGTYALTFRVAEHTNASATDSKTINITVNNVDRAPVISAGSVVLASDADSATVGISAFDADSTDTLTYTITSQANAALASCGISGSSLVVTRASNLRGQAAQTTQCTVQVSDGALTASAVYTVTINPKSMLSIDKVDAIVAGDTHRVDQGDTFDALPGDTLEFKVKVSNLYTSDEDVQITGVTGTIDIEDWSGDTKSWDNIKDYDLNADHSQTLDFKISSIPDDISDGTHKITLTIKGRDDNVSSVKYTLVWTFEMDINKDAEDIRIIGPAIDPSTVSCDRNAVLSVKISNLGTDNSDEIVFTARNPALGINIVDEGISLDEGDTTTKEYNIVIPKTAVAKSYPISLTTFFDSTRYDDNENSNTKTVQVTVEDCVPVVPPVIPPKTCTPDWNCGDWSECVGSKQVRVCTDGNTCGISTGKPSETQTCVVPTPVPAETSIFSGNGIYLIGGLVLLNVLLLIGIVVLFVNLLKR